jgi:D-aminopeptidase
VLGGSSQIIKVPSAKLDIAVAVNRADLNAADLANKIIDVCVEGLDPPHDGQAGAPRAGIFMSRRSGRVAELSAHDDVQLVAIDGAQPVPMTFDAGGMLQLPAFMSFLQRRLSFSDAMIRLVEFGDEDVMEPVEREADAKLGPLSGIYAAHALDVRAIVSDGTSGPQLRTVGRHGAVDYRLEPIGERIWKAISSSSVFPLSFIVTFDPDGQGLGITADRLMKVRFIRVASPSSDPGF